MAIEPNREKCWSWRNCRQKCCWFFLPSPVIIIILIINLSMRAPRLSLLDLKLPSSINSSDSITTFKLKFHNPNSGIGIRYTNLTTSFKTYPTRSDNKSNTIAVVIIPAFYQGFGKKSVKNGSGNTNEGMVGVLGQKIRVQVIGSVRYECLVSISSWNKLSVEGAAGVDAQGLYASEKGVRFISSASKWCPEILWYIIMVLASISI